MSSSTSKFVAQLRGFKGTVLLLSLFSFTIVKSSSASGEELMPSDVSAPDSASQPMSVLQKRFFLKAWRPEAGVLFGSIQNESYTKTYVHGARLSVFFNETIGIEAQYARTTVQDSDDRKALNGLQYRPKSAASGEGLVSPDPEVNAIHSMTDLAVTIAPFYGKLNFADLMILYSDLYVSAGASRIGTDQGILSGLLLGVGQRFYVKQNFSFRADYRVHRYSETRAGGSSTKNSNSIELGFGYFIR